MRLSRFVLSGLFALTLAACGRAPSNEADAVASAPPGPVIPWRLPTPPGAAQPDLWVTADGRILLSWLSAKQGRRNALQFAEFDRQGRWNGPRTIAVGQALLANWADTPHIASTPDGALWVHWLQTTPGQAGYRVMLARSRDGGMNWSTQVQAHDDASAAEHGFVALWPQTRDALGVAWLDGRNATGGHDGAHAEHPAATALRAAVFDQNLSPTARLEIDPMACDCCQTDAAMTDRGALLIYRDRDANDIRDAVATRFDGTTWTASKPVHADGWKMTACPVNGPAVAARGNVAVVGWYTAADERPTLKLAASNDAGDRFGAPVTVAQGDAVQGRVDVALDDKHAWVLWLEEDAKTQTLWIARYAPDLSRELQRTRVATLQGRGRGTGFPQLVLRDGAAFVAWTDVVDGVPQLRGASVAAR